MTKKWFYTALTEAYEQLTKKYEHLNCIFQEVGKDRVIEQWKGQNPGQVADMLLVVVTNQGQKASVLIYKTEYIQGWATSINGTVSLVVK